MDSRSPLAGGEACVWADAGGWWVWGGVRLWQFPSDHCKFLRDQEAHQLIVKVEEAVSEI